MSALQAARLACAALCVFGATLAYAQSVVPPVPAGGPYPVACSNIEQDFSRVAPGTSAEDYWRGLTTEEGERYVVSLLASRQDALVATFVAPDDASLFARWRGRTIEYAILACYPTTAATRAPITRCRTESPYRECSAGRRRPSCLPRPPACRCSRSLTATPAARCRDSYFDAQLAFASWGFVVLAPFHGDLRYTPFAPDSGDNGPGYIPVWSEFVAMQSTRPLSISAGLDLIAAHPQWRDRIDLNRTGAFGISQGGETLMLLGGAEVTYGLATLQSKRVTLDPRIKAAVGYIPYFGLEELPAFGADQRGVVGVTLPYLAISGTRDDTAPVNVTRRALEQMSGVRGLVTLEGVGHDLDPPTTDDIRTWALTFYAAWLVGDASWQARLDQMQSVQGGFDDRKALYVGGGPAPGPGQVVDVIEFHRASIDHYFITAFPEEAAALDAGMPPGWKRTGYTFKALAGGERSGQRRVPFLRHAGTGPELALLHDKLRGMRVGEGQSRLDLRGAGVSRRRAACFRLRRELRVRDAPLQQRNGRAGEPPLPDRRRGDRSHGRERMDRRGNGVLRPAYGIVNPTPRRAEESSAARLDLHGPTGSLGDRASP